MRRFNVTGLCVPDEDYMVDISGKIAQIRKLVDDRCYFTINRARQYGKTTTLAWLEKTLKDDYLVASISFEGIDDESFASPESFCQMFLGLIRDAMQFTDASDEYAESWMDGSVSDFKQLGKHIAKLCKNQKVVLMIDEVDKTSNNRTFVHFLGMLREKFLARRNRKDYTFHSVILAGVYDIRNLKLKMINEGTYTPTPSEGKLYNSPWNIAVEFKVDMSFNPNEIATMLSEYEADHDTGMDIETISEEIYDYTSGYPFLVSRICQCIDEEIDKEWTRSGVQEAVKTILDERNTLFDDITKNLESDEKLHDLMYNILIGGASGGLSVRVPVVERALMYGFISLRGSTASVSNRIFELVIADYFITKESIEAHSSGKRQNGTVMQREVVKDGRLDMELCLRKFAEHYDEIFGKNDAEFLERHGRLLFLTYLKPLINGYGFYHIESQFTDQRRMDIVVDFGSDQFLIELKLWKGDSKHQEAYDQLLGYMESKNIDAGYLLTFDFRKGASRDDRLGRTHAEWVDFGGKRIFNVVV